MQSSVKTRLSGSSFMFVHFLVCLCTKLHIHDDDDDDYDDFSTTTLDFCSTGQFFSQLLRV